LQFFVGIGGAIVITIVLFAAVAAGIQIRGQRGSSYSYASGY